MTFPPYTPILPPRHCNRGEMLERQFLDCLDLIERHQDLLLPSGYLSDYQALGWIVRKDGCPQITTAGMKAVRELQARRLTGRKDR